MYAAAAASMPIASLHPQQLPLMVPNTTKRTPRRGLHRSSRAGPRANGEQARGPRALQVVELAGSCVTFGVRATTKMTALDRSRQPSECALLRRRAAGTSATGRLAHPAVAGGGKTEQPRAPRPTRRIVSALGRNSVSVVGPALGVVGRPPRGAPAAASAASDRAHARFRAAAPEAADGAESPHLSAQKIATALRLAIGLRRTGLLAVTIVHQRRAVLSAHLATHRIATTR